MRQGAQARRSTLILKSSGNLRNDVEQKIIAPPLRFEVIDKLCTILEMKALKLEGIFRLSGNMTRVKLLTSTFGEDIENIDIFDEDPHTISGALKQYLRDQPVPLIPFEKYNNWCQPLESSQIEEERFEGLLKAVTELPNETLPILYRLLYLLSETSKYSEINKMTPENLGIVFGPTMLRADSFDLTALSRSHISAEAFAILIKNSARVLKTIPRPIKFFRFFEDPKPLGEKDWEILLTNSASKTYDLNQVVFDEGDENYHLFRIAQGRFRVEKGGRFIIELLPPAMFGEMSFLGRFNTSAAIISNENLSVVQMIEYSIVKSVFKLNPELYKTFYWTMAFKLAVKLAELEKKSDVKLLGPTATSTRTSTRSEQKTLKVFLSHPDGASCDIPIEEQTTAHEVCLGSLSHFFKIKPSNHATFRLYMVSDTLAAPVPLNDSESVYHKLVTPLANSPGFNFVFSDTAPHTKIDKKKFSLKTSVVLKDWPCTLNKRKGILYVTQHNLAHYSKKLGIEKREILHFKEISSVTKESEAEGNLLKVIVASMGKKDHATVYKFKFKGTESLYECHNLLQAVWQGYHSGGSTAGTPETVGRRRGTMTASPTPANRRGFSRPPNRTSTSIPQLAIEEVDEEPTTARPKSVVFHSEGRDNIYSLSASFNSPSTSDPTIDLEAVKEETEHPESPSAIIIPPYIQEDLDDAEKEELPTPDEWRSILSSAENLKFRSGEQVVIAGNRYQRIYQLISGCCRMENDEGGQLGKLFPGEIFGEVGFLTGILSATVIAEEESTRVLMIEAETLRKKFKKDPAFGARFYKYLATVCEHRVRKREHELFNTRPQETT
eukprot:TRINITY_DN13163_c0_g1_i1.p1 TRINITY_DN13163_c0_g1~~TRINITY_DN13163_c0_g1_i1.p1  ORF type:complete len:836 (+),score=191.19 TRINITY_DN13163_c0_g1_i1:20-2527(+)